MVKKVKRNYSLIGTKTVTTFLSVYYINKTKAILRNKKQTVSFLLKHLKLKFPGNHHSEVILQTIQNVLKISHACVGVSFLIKLQASGLQLY